MESKNGGAEDDFPFQLGDFTIHSSIFWMTFLGGVCLDSEKWWIQVCVVMPRPKMRYCTLPKTNSSPLKMGRNPKRKGLSSSPINFQGRWLLVSGKVLQTGQMQIESVLGSIPSENLHWHMEKALFVGMFSRFRDVRVFFQIRITLGDFTSNSISEMIWSDQFLRPLLNSLEEFFRIHHNKTGWIHQLTSGLGKSGASLVVESFFGSLRCQVFMASTNRTGSGNVGPNYGKTLEKHLGVSWFGTAGCPRNLGSMVRSNGLVISPTFFNWIFVRVVSPNWSKLFFSCGYWRLHVNCSVVSSLT